jgi:hypothetical protein
MIHYRRFDPMRNRMLSAALLLNLGLATFGLAARGAEPVADEGFVSIFSGKDLSGWDGDPRLWSVADGAIQGRSTEENPAKYNTFLIWRGGTVGDFELRLRFRVHSGNSGVQVRSRELGQGQQWRVGGYQTEVAPPRRAMGLWYDEAGKRGGLATAGQSVVIDQAGAKKVSPLGDREEIAKAYKEGDWNDLAITAKGHRLVQKINGVTFSELTDEQDGVAATTGILALQIHAGPPMQVEFKDIRLKAEKSEAGAAPKAAEPKAGAGKTALFNGKDLTGWGIVDTGDFKLHGKVYVQDGAVMLERGNSMTGIRWEGEFPKADYEVNLDGMRVAGGDFFCGMTFPIGEPKGDEGYATLICGGWGGMVVGLSNVDDYNASENQTTTGKDFQSNRWYHVRLRVTKPRIEVWIDTEKVVSLERGKHKFAVWPEQQPIRPFGIATWETGGAVKNITLERAE